MKLILAGDPGTYSNLSYPQFIYNCNSGRCKAPYRIPTPDIDSLQFYNFFGNVAPVSYSIELISTCGDNTVITLSTEWYVVGQLPDLRFYGVFKKFVATDPIPKCFVISFVFMFPDESEKRYFSEEFCFDICNDLMQIQSCYPDLKSIMAFDCNNIYYGFHNGEIENALGNRAVRYYHRVYVRQGVVLNTAHKTTFKTYLKRNFRTEIQKLWELRCELLPEWYKNYMMALIARGVIVVRETPTSDLVKYTLSETNFELVEEDFKLWKTTSTLIEICRQYFGCDDSSCNPPCIGNPTLVTISGPVEGLYTFTFTDGSLASNEVIEWQINKKDDATLISFGSIVGPAALVFTVDATVSNYHPDIHCYQLKWRKACSYAGAPFSDDFSDDFETAQNTGFTDYVLKDIGACPEGGEGGGGHDDVDITKYTFVEGPVTDICEMLGQATRTPGATADSITNGHRIKCTVQFSGDNYPTPVTVTADFTFEIGNAYSDSFVVHCHNGGGDYCSHIDTAILSVTVIP